MFCTVQNKFCILLTVRLIKRSFNLRLVFTFLFQNTQEIKRTLFNQTKQDKTCKFSRKASFSSYLQQYNRKQLNQLILCPFDVRRLVGAKGHETACFVCSAVVVDCDMYAASWKVNVTYGIAARRQGPVTQLAPPFSMPKITSRGMAATSAVRLLIP